MARERKNPISPMMQLIAERIMERRKQLEWTQEEASERCGIERGTWSTYERASVEIHASTLANIAEGMHRTPIQYFFGDVQTSDIRFARAMSRMKRHPARFSEALNTLLEMVADEQEIEIETEENKS